MVRPSPESAFFPIPAAQPGSGLAQLFLEHLERSAQSRHFPGLEHDGLFGFLALHEERVVAHLSVLEVPIEFPRLPGLDFFDPETPDWKQCSGAPRREGFVQTFFVEEPYRRRGIGRTLQRLAIDECSLRGLAQMRSWSAQDARANYALKMSMDFGVVPGAYYSHRARKWSRGCWFVWPLDADRP